MEEVIVIDSTPVSDRSRLFIPSSPIRHLPDRSIEIIELPSDSSIPIPSSSPFPVSRLEKNNIDDISYVSDVSEIDKANKKRKSVFFDSDDIDEFCVSPVQRKKHKITSLVKKTRDDKSDKITDHKKLNAKKKALNLANKTKRSREELLQEMIICTSLTYELSVRVESLSSSPNLIKWRRETNSIYDAATDLFIPSDQTIIIDEKFLAVVHVVNDEFCQLLKSGQFSTQITDLKQIYPDHCIICFLENQDTYLGKVRLRQQRDYTDRIRHLSDGIDNNNNRKKKKQKIDLILTREEYIDILVDIQVNHKINLFPTKNTHDTTSWLHCFTYTIASKRYDKHERLPPWVAHLGSITSGKTTKDCYVRSLQHFKFITNAVSEKICHNYPTLQHLAAAYEKSKKLDKPYIRESVDVALSRFFNTDDPDTLVMG